MTEPEPTPPPPENPLPLLTTFADQVPDPNTESSPSAFLDAHRSMDRRQRRRLAVSVATRSLGISALVLVGYFLLPLSADGKATGLVVLLVGLVVLAIVIVSELRRIIVSEHPALRGVQAVAVVVPLFIVVFAYAYVWMSNDDPASFTEPINRFDGIYFTVTMLSTVGFGDIAAVSQSARIVATVQMLLNLVLIGVVAKLIVGASRIGVQRRRIALTDPEAPTDPRPPDPPAAPRAAGSGGSAT